MIIVEGIDSVSIAVTDLEASANFYSDLLDFESIDDQSGDSMTLSLDPFKIKLIKVPSVNNQLSGLVKPTLSFIMDVDDFTEAISEIEEKGVKIVKGPEPSDKGEYLLFSDPDGNLIEISYKD